MSKTEHATLLARKIFNSHNAEEVRALVNLELDIDWGSEYSSGVSLLERAFRAIKDEDVFRLWWTNVQQKNPQLTLWSELPNNKNLASIFLEPEGSFAYKMQLLHADPGTPAQQAQLGEHPQAIESALRPMWNVVSQNLKKERVLPLVVKLLDQYRADNLYLAAESLTEFNATRPTVLSPKNALDMFTRLSVVGVSSKNIWYLKEFLRSPWEQWDANQWEMALKGPRVGLLLEGIYAASNENPGYNKATQLRNSVEEICTLVERFYKKVPVGDVVSEDWIKKESVALGKFKWPRIDDGCLKIIYKSVGRGLLTALKKVSVTSDNAFAIGVGFAVVDTTCFKSSHLSPSALQTLAQGKLPATVEEMVQQIANELTLPMQHYDQRKTLHNLLNPQTVNMLVAHIAVNLEDQHQAVFLQSLPAPQENDTDHQESLAAINWSIRGLKTAATPLQKSNWAGVFWRHIFALPIANQHYWLKKVHEIQDVIVPVSFWNAELEATVLKALEKRKSNDLIHSVLSKFVLANATASVTTEDQPAPVQRRSKL